MAYKYRKLNRKLGGRQLWNTMLLLVLLAGFVSPVWAASHSLTGNQQDVQPALPLRAAFYYPWFPGAWNQKEIQPYTNYHPSLGFYSSTDSAVIRKHISAMQYGGIVVGVSSWWGQGSTTDQALPIILSATTGSIFRWSIYYEPESLGNPSAAQITNDLTYLRDHYGSDPSFLRIGGRFVVFVYADGADGCGMVDRWMQANTANAYIVLKVFAGYRNCSNQPDGWHQYAPAVASDNQDKYSYTISPGFWKVDESPRLARNLDQWNTNIRNMIASGASFQLITTFNEWGEGTAVESASEWSSSSGYGAYLDALHNNGQTGPTPTFTDVPFSYWAHDYIQAIYNAGITGGCNTTPLAYCPADTVTRAQMAIFLLRGIRGQNFSPPPVGNSTGFNDVPPSHWAAAWIAELASNGISSGCGGDNYCPGGPVTRAQMAVFLLRSKYGKFYTPPTGSGNMFNDVPSSHWASAWIEELAKEKISSGCGNNNYCPDDIVTRAQMAIFIQRTFNIPIP